jgi:spore maturation protein CgeB
MCKALQDSGFVVLPYAMDKMRVWWSINQLFKDIIATAVSTRNNFTHVLLVGAVFFPRWVIQTIQRCGVKVIYWSLEDPHAFDQNYKFMEWADYYFTNEIKVAEKFKEAVYLPTAGCHHICLPAAESVTDLPERYQKIFNNDIVFCGNVYPNRQKLLEEILPFLEKKGYRFGIAGITALMIDKMSSPLRKYIIGFHDEHGETMEGVIDHRWLVMLYGYSKIALNLERDPYYEYNEKYSTNRIHKIKGESLNPRAYEIAMCGGGLQLIDDKRAELFSGRTIEPDKHCVCFRSAEELCQKIEYYMEHEEARQEIVSAARQHALRNHTYDSRAKRLIKAIWVKEKKKDDLKKMMLGDIAGGIFGKKKGKAN